jgi:hypothetical protein
MSIERELLNEVLEYFDPLGLNTEHCGDLPERIKELLAQPEQEQEQEPVAWKVIDGTNGKYMFSRIKPTERSYKYDVVIPLYASPQTRKFLSVKQAKDLWETTFKSAVPYYTFYEICVAIEQYQDIGVDDE